MGCDIHLHVEVRQGEGSPWEVVYPTEPPAICRDDYFTNDTGDDEAWEALVADLPPEVKTYNTYAAMAAAEGPTDWEARWEHPLYVGRNYDLFAVLADVRNDTGIVPISKPRGIPGDVSVLGQWYMGRFGTDGHSHSYLTLKELLAYNWRAGFTRRGRVTPENYKHYKETGAPSTWFGWSSERLISNQEMEQYLSDVNARNMDALASVDLGHGRHHVRKPVTEIEWQDSLLKSMSEFVDETIPALQQLGDPDNVRIIFYFDN